MLRYRDVVRELYGGEMQTTNNRMELMAVIQALQALKRPGLVIKLFSDSRYVLSGISEWMPGWKARGWKTANRKPVLNQDLWQQLDALSQLHQIEWHWVKGHSGIAGNEKADELANKAIAELSAGKTEVQI